MSKIQIEYRDVADAAAAELLRSRERVVIEGNYLRPSDAWLRWMTVSDADGGILLVLSEHSRPEIELARLRPDEFRRMTDDELKRHVAGMR